MEEATPKWVQAQKWEGSEKKRALAILDRRARSKGSISIEQLRKLMGKSLPTSNP